MWRVFQTCLKRKLSDALTLSTFSSQHIEVHGTTLAIDIAVVEISLAGSSKCYPVLLKTVCNFLSF